MFICIAGGNNIAVDVLDYLVKFHNHYGLGIIGRKSDSGENSWQKSLRWYAKTHEIVEYTLEDLYSKENMVFLSLEFDRIIRPSLFVNARLFNIHFSLLPAYKGMYTSVFPILNGDEKAGVTLHRIDSGIDTGEIIDQFSFPIAKMTCRELYISFIKYGTRLIIQNLDNIIKGREVSYPQPAVSSTYYSRQSIDYNNLTIDLNQTAEGVDRQIRAFSFREYQMPKVYGHKIISARITGIRSTNKPGTVISGNRQGMLLSTIDYVIALYYDRLDELMEACKEGDTIQVKEICSVKEHVNTQESNGWSPLMVATYHNQTEIVKYLIMMGADIKAVNHRGTNLLMYAKDAYKDTGDNTLFRLYKELGLSEFTSDYQGHNLKYYMQKEGISMEELTALSKSGGKIIIPTRNAHLQL